MTEQHKATTPSSLKNKGGRPTKLTAAVLKAANEYVDNSESFVNSLLPTIERLALTIGVSRETLYQWEQEDQRFSDILEKLRGIQADKLLQNGLTGRWNSTITKLVLSKHGYVEKQATDLTTNGKELPAPILGGLTQEKPE